MKQTSLKNPGCDHSVKSEEVLIKELRILEMIAKGCTLPDILDEIVVFVELQLKREALCSILLLDREGRHLFHGSAPGLPEEYVQIINGMAIGPCAGSCGTAAWRRETVIVENTGVDPLWTGYRSLAKTYNLHACWSIPICDSDDKVLGTLAVYHPEPYRPSQDDLRLVKLAVYLTRIAIQEKRLKDELKITNEELQQEIRKSQKYEIISNTAKELMTVINRDYVYEAANKAYYNAHGKTFWDIIGKTAEEIWGKETFQTILKKRLDDCFAGNEVQYEACFAFPALGKCYFSVRYYPHFNEHGEVTHAVVVNQRAILTQF